MKRWVQFRDGLGGAGAVLRGFAPSWCIFGLFLGCTVLVRISGQGTLPFGVFPAGR